MEGVKLSEITYEEAKKLINEDTIILLPIGGGTKEHGSHLPMGTDFYVTEWMTDRVIESYPVVALPTLSYAYYPAFIDWAGSVSIEAENFIRIVKDIIKSFAKFGVKKFLIIDGGVSTHSPLKILSSDLHNELGISVGVTDCLGLGKEVEDEVCEQEKGGHGDEGETSCMLYIKQELVKMDKAVEEYRVGIKGAYNNGIKKVSVGGKMDTPHGIHGNSKLATVEKGKKIMDAKIVDIIRFLEHF